MMIIVNRIMGGNEIKTLLCSAGIEPNPGPSLSLRHTTALVIQQTDEEESEDE